MLRDRLVCGIRDERILWQLLSERGLDLKKAMELAQGAELVAKNALEMQAMAAEGTSRRREETVQLQQKKEHHRLGKQTVKPHGASSLEGEEAK